FKSKINQLCEHYMSDLDKNKYDSMLDDPGLILGVNCGRHDATLFKAMRYYFKYSGEWLDLTDEQRFERVFLSTELMFLMQHILQSRHVNWNFKLW
ncbi:MAG: hypothetical protein WBV84_14175, partial [Nitrososphaeraceae archaeon]